MKFEPISLWLERIIRFVLGSLFIVAGVMKLRDPEAFTVAIDAFGLVSGSVSKTLSIVLPIFEILAGFGLILNVPASLHIVTGILLIFIAILLYGMHLGLDIDCGCYGPDDVELRAFGGLRRAFHRDLAMATGLFFLYVRRAYKAFFDRPIFNHKPHKELLCEQKEPYFQD